MEHCNKLSFNRFLWQQYSWPPNSVQCERSNTASTAVVQSQWLLPHQ